MFWETPLLATMLYLAKVLESMTTTTVSKFGGGVFNSQPISIGEVYIGNNCWIGSNVVILKGTYIGDNCVIGAGAVISGIVNDGTLVVQRRDLVYQAIE